MENLFRAIMPGPPMARGVHPSQIKPDEACTIALRMHNGQLLELWLGRADLIKLSQTCDQLLASGIGVNDEQG